MSRAHTNHDDQVDDDAESVTTIATTAQTLSAVFTTAMTNWPTTLRFTLICAALTLPIGAGLALYLLIR